MLGNRFCAALRATAQRSARPNVACIQRTPRMFTSYNLKGATQEELNLDHQFYNTRRTDFDWYLTIGEKPLAHSIPKANLSDKNNALFLAKNYNHRTHATPADDPVTLGIACGMCIFALPCMWYWYHYIFNETFMDHRVDKGDWRAQWEANHKSKNTNF